MKFEDLPVAISELLEKVDRIELYLKTVRSIQNQEGGELLNIADAGKLLGLSKNTIYKMVQKRILPHSKRGKRLYFLKEELMNWIKGGKKKTETELTAEAEEQFISKNKRSK
jgi:excisionase family DNA binding protein